MTAQRTLDVSHLPPFSISSDAPLWWGQALLALVEGMMFFILIAMYFYYRLSVDIWPPPGIQLPTRVLPALCVLLLLASCIGSYLASEAAKKNDRRGMIFGLALNLVLAIAAMTARAIDWRLWNYKWSTTVYGSITWSILFLHTIDVVADLMFTAVLIVILMRGMSGPRHRIGVHVDSVIWYFLVAIWIPLYITVFWVPYFWGGSI
jgi:cytochrome c oxidase subunit III